MATQKDFAAALIGHNELYEAAERTAEQWMAIHGGRGEYIRYIKIDCDEDPEDPGGWIEIHTEESQCGCCSNETHEHNIPISYLWDPGWQQVAEKAEAERKVKENEAREKRRAELEHKRQEQRKTEYLKLKEEFEK